MRFACRAFLFFTACFAGVAFAGPSARANDEPVRAEEVFTPDVAVIQGVVEGLTEYLPVSSTGHLILVNDMLDLSRATPLIGRDGQPVTVERKPGIVSRIAGKLAGEEPKKPYPQEPYTVKAAADDYSVVIQFGAILAVVAAFWTRVSGTVAGVLRGRSASLLLSRNLLVAFFPAAALGLAASKFIEEKLFHPVTVACALIAGGVVMLWVERRVRQTAGGAESGPDLPDMSLRQAGLVGLCQCAALVPGVSRSMSTIVGGYLAGLSPARATEFSFLLGLVTLTAASAYKCARHAPQLLATLSPGGMALGMAVAGLLAFVSVKWMIGRVTRRGLGVFAWYRFALGGLVLLWFYGL